MLAPLQLAAPIRSQIRSWNKPPGYPPAGLVPFPWALTVMRFIVCTTRMTAAPESTYDTLRRISHGDLAAVIRSIPDPIDRWQAEVEWNGVPGRDDLDRHFHLGQSNGAARERDRIVAHLSDIDTQLANDFNDALEHTLTRDRTSALRNALRGYIERAAAPLQAAG